MKTKTMFVVVLALTALAFLVLPGAFGQDPTTNSVPTFDEKATKFVTLNFSYWQVLLVPICLVLTTLVKKYVALIPDNMLPFVAPILGGLLDMAATKFGLWSGNAAVGATMGALATWFHQAYSQNAPEPEDQEAPPS